MCGMLLVSMTRHNTQLQQPKTMDTVLTRAVRLPGGMEPDTLERMVIFSRHFALFLTMYSTSCKATQSKLRTVLCHPVAIDRQ